VIGIVVFVAAQGVAGAWSSARPPECVPLDTGRASNVWERAKAPELRRYCDLLASGASKLASSTAMARDVVALADEAEKLVANKAAPLVLKGRALAQLGMYTDAHKALSDARGRDDRALDDPHALFAWARVLARTARAQEAADAYRALLPRSSLLTLADRSAAEIEAGLLAMSRGASAMDECVPILRQAVRDSQEIAQTVAVLALALALDRSGDKDEARALVADRVRGDPRSLLTGARARDLLGPAGALEVAALGGIALEQTDPASAHAEWTKYLEANAKGPWLENARAHIAAVAGKRGKKR
jgi:tetratricopeptide (TPR) repeat protein